MIPVKSNELPKNVRDDIIYKIVSEQGLTDIQKMAMRMCLSSGSALLLMHRGAFIGGIGWTHGTCPRTAQRCIIEQMLYVVPKYRGKGVADELVVHLELVAKAHDASVIYAGSSLNSHEAAKAVYEAAGFTTSYSFRKEI